MTKDIERILNDMGRIANVEFKGSARSPQDFIDYFNAKWDDGYGDLIRGDVIHMGGYGDAPISFQWLTVSNVDHSAVVWMFESCAVGDWL